jgi:hypothetical protein
MSVASNEYGAARILFWGGRRKLACHPEMTSMSNEVSMAIENIASVSERISSNRASFASAENVCPGGGGHSFCPVFVRHGEACAYSWAVQARETQDATVEDEPLDEENTKRPTKIYVYRPDTPSSGRSISLIPETGGNVKDGNQKLIFRFDHDIIYGGAICHLISIEIDDMILLKCRKFSWKFSIRRIIYTNFRWFFTIYY